MIKESKLVSRQMLVIVLALLLFCIGPLSIVSAQEEEASVENGVSIKLDGKIVKITDPILLLNGRLYVPIAHIAAMFDANISWDKVNEEATIHTIFKDKIVLGNGVPVVYFNDGRYRMDAAPFVTDGRTYIPLRHVAELLHAKVNFSPEDKIVDLETVQPAVTTENYGAQTVNPSVLDKKAEPFSEKDLMLLAKITQVEAGYESYEGQLGIANVILNRMKDSRFPDSIYSVIYSGNQFPPAHNGLLDKSRPSASALRAAKDALNGKNNVENAVYFYNSKVSKGSFWSSLKVIVTIGNHSFAK